MNLAHTGRLPDPSGGSERPGPVPGGQAPAMERPPPGETGARAWLRHNLFSSGFNAGLTVVLVLVFGWVAAIVVRWAVFEANWGVILKNWRVILWGLYPRQEIWRPTASLMLVFLLTALTWLVGRRPRMRRLRTPILVGWVLSPLVIGLLLRGFELPTLRTIGNNLGYYLFRPDLLSAVNALWRGPTALFLVAAVASTTRVVDDRPSVRRLAIVPVILIGLLNLPSAVRVTEAVPPALAVLVAAVAGWLVGRSIGRLLSWTEHGRHIVNWLWLLALVTCVFVLTSFPVGRPEFDPVQILTSVQPSLWSGILLTLILATVTAVLSFPLGVLLALGRASRLPVIRASCVALIEVVRGVPLITILFMAQVMLPMFLPMNLSIDRVLRAIAGMTIFTAAYLAEVIRGGLQAVPREQVEAARALGLSELLVTFLVVLPQALRLVIPAIMGQLVSMFKDTTLVAIIGLLELLGILSSITKQREFLGTVREVYLLAAAFYFVVCYAMSVASRRAEVRLGVGTR
jgi:His/Glu/Gln/Arg/opine family amino acid ABC transporter permease subunit